MQKGAFDEVMPALVAQLDAHLTGDQEIAGSTLAGLATFFCDHEIFSWVTLSLLLIWEGQLSVSREECAEYWLTT